MNTATIVADCNPGENNVVFFLRYHGYDEVQRKRLPLGDFQISYKGSVVLFERKTVEDWRSSMTDGRLDAQRARAEELFAESGVKLRGVSEKFRGGTICSRNAPVSTRTCPGIVESRTVLILCRYEVYSHLRPSYSHPFFRNRGSAPRGTVTTFGSQ
jgi:hypothetical protein